MDGPKPCKAHREFPTGKNLFSLQGTCKPLYFPVRDCSVVYKAKAGTIAIGKSRFGIPPPKSKISCLRMSLSQSVTPDTLGFFPKFVSKSKHLFLRLFVCLNYRVILFQIKLSSLHEKSMNSPIVFKLKTYAPHTVRSLITKP